MARSPAAPLTTAGVTTAVALITRLALTPDVPREEVLGLCDPQDALAAMEAITAGVLKGVCPGDNGAGVLSRIGVGLAVMEGGAGNGR